MFSGIVQAIGTVSASVATPGGRRLEVSVPADFGRFREGESVCVSGVCLTALRAGRTFAADLSEETLRVTRAGALRRGHRVNLERAVRPFDRLSGHLVQGHVDGVGRVLRVEGSGEGRTVTFGGPARVLRYVVEKGSVAVDGVSLTAFGVTSRSFRCALIPKTLAATTLSELERRDRVNLEADPIAKYVEKLVRRR